MYTLATQPQNIDLTPEKAREFLALNQFEGQRPLRPRIIADYAEKIRTGEMRPVSIGVAILTYDGSRRLLVNGQHSCHAVVAAGKTHRASCEYYKCPGPNDLYHLYASYDTHAGRSQQNIMAAARPLMADERLQKTSARYLALCGSALAYFDRSGERPVFSSATSSSKVRKPELCEENADDVVWVAEVINGGDDGKHLCRVGVAAAMIATRRANQEKAATFWENVKTGAMLGTKDPQKKLRDALKDKHAVSGKGAQQHADYYTLCVSWWNSWITGTPRKFARLALLDVPDVAGGPKATTRTIGPARASDVLGSARLYA